MFIVVSSDAQETAKLGAILGKATMSNEEQNIPLGCQNHCLKAIRAHRPIVMSNDSFAASLDRSSRKIHCTSFLVNLDTIAHFLGTSAVSPGTLLQEPYNCWDIDREKKFQILD
jgi:hypothetical protein